MSHVSAQCEYLSATASVAGAQSLAPSFAKTTTKTTKTAV